MESVREQQERDLEQSFEILEGRLCYVALRNPPVKRKKCAFFSVDEELAYWNYFLDFGPLNLGQLYRFCQILQELLDDPKLKSKLIYYYSSTDSKKRANAVFLVCAFSMFHLGKSLEEAYEPFQNIYPPFPPFHDATPGRCDYDLTVKDCLKAVFCGLKKHTLINLKTFNVDTYEHYERVENGDLNWIVEGKFLAFASPHQYKMVRDGYKTFTPECYIPYFKKMGVNLVIRLNNKKSYSKTRFEENGIKHVDLFHVDGSTPPDRILQRFLEICETHKGAIGVHCKAGLGRTGTLIGAYLIKHFQMSAAEAIGWIRICRPGSVIGPQQHFLESMELVLQKEKTVQRYFNTRVDDDEYTLEEKSSDSDERKTQGDHLRSKSPTRFTRKNISQPVINLC